MKKLRFVFLVFPLMLPADFSSYSAPQNDKNFVIMAYYVASRDNYHPEQLPLDQLTHIIFSFTQVVENEMKFRYEQSAEKLLLLSQQKKKHPHLKVMIACGGWGGSGGFSGMASSAQNRKKFVDSAIEFIRHYNLDGLDIDWEYPGMLGAGNPYLPEDRENFTALMRELRAAMDASDRDLTLTFASAGWKQYYDHIELGEVMKYANYMNVMTYDLVSGGSPYTGHHTNLGWIKPENLSGTEAEKVSREKNRPLDPRSAEQIITYCMNQGVDPGQIVIGAAFYGRAWKGVPPENNGLYQKNEGVWIGWAPYADIREKYEEKNGFTRYWDPIAKAPYLYNHTDSIFISFEDTVSVRLKTEYALKNELGGIMFWELGLDTKDYDLLGTIYESSNR